MWRDCVAYLPFVVDANFTDVTSLRLLFLQIEIPAIYGADVQGDGMSAPDELPLNAMGQWVEEAECLFRRYLFIRLIAGQSNFAPIRSTRGVSGLVRFGTTPAVVPDAVVEALRTMPLQDRPMFNAGDAVTITAGAFAGVAAEFVALKQMPDGEMRALVLLELLSKMQKIAVPASALRLARL